MHRLINRIVIHCSDSNFGDADLIKEWHIARGFKTIGYHFVIRNGFITSAVPSEYNQEIDGTIQGGRPVEEVGAHALGFNMDSIGICLIGKTKFSRKQLTTLLYLLGLLMNTYPSITISRVVGHCELTKEKTCPNFDVRLIRDILVKFTDFTLLKK